MRPLNKGQGHSFWYQSISHMTSMLSIVTFVLGRIPFSQNTFRTDGWRQSTDATLA